MRPRPRMRSIAGVGLRRLLRRRVLQLWSHLIPLIKQPFGSSSCSYISSHISNNPLFLSSHPTHPQEVGLHRLLRRRVAHAPAVQAADRCGRRQRACGPAGGRADGARGAGWQRRSGAARGAAARHPTSHPAHTCLARFNTLRRLQGLCQGEHRRLHQPANGRHRPSRPLCSTALPCADFQGFARDNGAFCTSRPLAPEVARVLEAETLRAGAPPRPCLLLLMSCYQGHCLQLLFGTGFSYLSHTVLPCLVRVLRGPRARGVAAERGWAGAPLLRRRAALAPWPAPSLLWSADARARRRRRCRRRPRHVAAGSHPPPSFCCASLPPDPQALAALTAARTALRCPPPHPAPSPPPPPHAATGPQTRTRWRR